MYHVLDVIHGAHPEIKVWSTDAHILVRDYQERLLKEAGFGMVDIFCGYDFEPYDRQTSRRLIAVARK